MARTPDSSGKQRGESIDASAQKTAKDRQARKYRFACGIVENVRLDAMEACPVCLAIGEQCYFSKVPSVAYSIALQNRLETCESLLNRLRVANDEERSRLLENHFNGNAAYKSGKRRRPGDGIDVTTNKGAHEEHSPGGTDVAAASSDNELVEVFNETSVDDHGRICFYGTTSLFHVQPDVNPRGPTLPQDVGDHVLSLQTEPFSYDAISQWDNNLSLDTPSPATSVGTRTDIGTYMNVDVDSQLCQELLDTYWCWPHHLHLVLCRKIFMRDILANGPYVTPFLLNTILAEAARYSDRPDAAYLGQTFAQKTLDTLAQEVDRGSSIPTIQGLLIYSARECACGRTSQGWLYTGMAFSMMRDMGIHIHLKKLLHLGGRYSAAELALRQQIFWSCYTWDKTMSLCLGRAPAMHDFIAHPSTDFLLDGDEADTDVWKPKFATTSALELISDSHDRLLPSHFISYNGIKKRGVNDLANGCDKGLTAIIAELLSCDSLH
ncbi:MAG: hypothetical protein OHK93_000748 [Ramalina farinacea]|uniref:Xylanolytic transcriptional activator regulatory domain-containing protein n=1 Tax=Ramalina farinacea TaxID=258253 RepID=A0AA43QR13_9LECA|nr:hypothetical protein [Ramalina farinacea]